MIREPHPTIPNHFSDTLSDLSAVSSTTCLPRSEIVVFERVQHLVGGSSGKSVVERRSEDATNHRDKLGCLLSGDSSSKLLGYENYKFENVIAAGIWFPSFAHGTEELLL